MSVLTVLKLWEDSQIRTTVKSSGTSAEMEISDFKKALRAEIGSDILPESDFEFAGIRGFQV